MNFGTYFKQPSEVLDYDLDYREWLTSGDNVQSATVAVTPTGLTVDSTFINDPRVKIWLSAGTAGSTYKVTVTMTTADGRVREDEFKLKVKEQ